MGMQVPYGRMGGFTSSLPALLAAYYGGISGYQWVD
jgi:hypothetical protein